MILNSRPSRTVGIDSVFIFLAFIESFDSWGLVVTGKDTKLEEQISNKFFSRINCFVSRKSSYLFIDFILLMMELETFLCVLVLTTMPSAIQVMNIYIFL